MRDKNRGYSAFAILMGFVLAVLCVYGALWSGRESKAEAPSGDKYMGAGTCASSNCHGAGEARKRPGIEINQNELSIWFTKDKHRRAYDLLLNAESKLIAKNLRLPQPAEKSEKCLVCHSAYASPALLDEGVDITDGVSCETCHGPSERWLQPHTASDWTYEKSLELGMYDTKNVFRRTEICLDCHIGNGARTVDHELIAAGHPDLNRFELDTFLASMPQHWRREPEEAALNGWAGTKRWSAGQTVSLRRSMEQLSYRTKKNSWRAWPDFADFDCFSCHHDLGTDPWRQAKGYTRTPGLPPWNTARYVTVRHLAAKISPSLKGQIDKEVATLSGLLDKAGSGGPSQIAASAARLADLMRRLEAAGQSAAFDRGLTLGLLLSISGDGDYISNGGVRPAEQAALALETLFFTYSSNIAAANAQEIRSAISGLFDIVKKPESYEPRKFNNQMKAVNRLLSSNK
ncbi:MAG: multiheme c-type cytochrome [Deltaproteobacteria bacterium]